MWLLCFLCHFPYRLSIDFLKTSFVSIFLGPSCFCSSFHSVLCELMEIFLQSYFLEGVKVMDELSSFPLTLEILRNRHHFFSLSFISKQISDSKLLPLFFKLT